MRRARKREASSRSRADRCSCLGVRYPPDGLVERAPELLLLRHHHIQGLNARARRGARQPRRRKPRGGGRERRMFYGNRFTEIGVGVGGGAFGPALALFEEPFEPPRRSELHEGHRDAHQHAGGPPAVPHRGVQRKTPPVLREVLQRVQGLCFRFSFAFFFGGEGTVRGRPQGPTRTREDVARRDAYRGTSRSSCTRARRLAHRDR